MINKQHFLMCVLHQLNQVTVDDEEGVHDSLTFQRLQIMLLEQFGEDFVVYFVRGHFLLS